MGLRRLNTKMTPREQELADTLAKHPSWKWRVGTRTPEVLQEDPQWGLPVWDAATITKGSPGRVEVLTDLLKQRGLHGGAVPDLSEPGTQGGLLQMIAEFAQPFILQKTPDGWVGHIAGSLIATETLGEVLALVWLAGVEGRG